MARRRGRPRKTKKKGLNVRSKLPLTFPIISGLEPLKHGLVNVSNCDSIIQRRDLSVTEWENMVKALKTRKGFYDYTSGKAAKAILFLNKELIILI